VQAVSQRPSRSFQNGFIDLWWQSSIGHVLKTTCGAVKETNTPQTSA
jgi:hypothetical protein